MENETAAVKRRRRRRRNTRLSENDAACNEDFLKKIGQEEKEKEKGFALQRPRKWIEDGLKMVMKMMKKMKKM